MHENGDVPEILQEPWLFLSAVLMVITCAVFLLSVTFSAALVAQRTWDSLHAENGDCV